MEVPSASLTKTGKRRKDFMRNISYFFVLFFFFRAKRRLALPKGGAVLRPPVFLVAGF